MRLANYQSHRASVRSFPAARCDGPSQSAFTLVELLVVIAIIGILVALLLPAVQAARESARRADCQNNIKQLLTGLHLFHDAKKTFPAAQEPFRTDNAADDFNHSWVPYIMPYIEEQALHDQYRFDKSWKDSLTNSYITRRQESAVVLKMLLCPSTHHEIRAVSDYAAINGPANYDPDNNGTVDIPNGWYKGQSYSLGVFPAVPARDPNSNSTNSRIKISQITDGTTYTIMLGECAGRTDPHAFWADGDHAFAHHEKVFNVTPADELYSDHPTGLHIGMADASVRFFKEDTPKWVIDVLATRALAELFHGEL